MFHVHKKSAHWSFFSAINAASESRYHTRYQKSPLKHKLWVKQPVRVARAPPGRWSGLSLPGPKGAVARPAGGMHRTPGASPGDGAGGPRPSQALTWRTRALSARPLRHPPDFQTCKVGGRGSSFPFYIRRAASFRSRPGAVNSELSR